MFWYPIPASVPPSNAPGRTMSGWGQLHPLRLIGIAPIMKYEEWIVYERARLKTQYLELAVLPNKQEQDANAISSPDSSTKKSISLSHVPMLPTLTPSKDLQQ